MGWDKWHEGGGNRGQLNRFVFECVKMTAFCDFYF
jgi:hypothetical protein